MKGSVTIFLAMTLSALAGFVLLLTGAAVRNAEKVRFECAADIGMNAVLSEYHIGLFERYGLLYVDASYLHRKPSVSNIEERLKFYIEENTVQVLQGPKAPWGSLKGIEVTLSSLETAADHRGASMRSQAICFVQDRNIAGEEREAFAQMREIQALEAADPMGQWDRIMEQVDASVANPADWVYALAGSDVLYLAEVDTKDVSSVQIHLKEYCSHRPLENGNAGERQYRQDDEKFLSYLYDKMGYLGHPKEQTLLHCQIEYLTQGENSDLKNVRKTAQRISRWRFADNVRCALADGSLRAQAAAEAEKLEAVRLQPEWKEPVTESLLYACAFLETVGDLKALYGGGSVPVRKTQHQMSVAHVMEGSRYTTGSNSGFSYGQYLACMLLLEKETDVNLRTMDLMEMDLRLSDGNSYFKMDWCVERYEAEVSAAGSTNNRYVLKRKYGYF